MAKLGKSYYYASLVTPKRTSSVFRIEGKDKTVFSNFVIFLADYTVHLNHATVQGKDIIVHEMYIGVEALYRKLDLFSTKRRKEIFNTFLP